MIALKLYINDETVFTTSPLIFCNKAKMKEERKRIIDSWYEQFGGRGYIVYIDVVTITPVIVERIERKIERKVEKKVEKKVVIEPEENKPFVRVKGEYSNRQY